MKIILADDHSLFREGLRSMLEPDAVCYEASSLPEMLDLLQDHPDANLILMDLKMPGMVDFQGLDTVRERHPDTPLIIVSMHCEPDVIQTALSRGISGYIPKTHSFESMRSAIDLVLSGTPYVPQEALTDVNTHLSKKAKLTRRQQEIYELLIKGRTNQEIADELFISLSTVKMHVSMVLERIGVKNRTQLLADSRNIFD
ncbi:response regulator transcription factor [endosymbiont of Lamellibrachia barhami]|uniref:response regulator transcription factor n=1 Tax=endosymbiont of Lamellibrachia barhami TaxID=205975 RepID=UPI0015A79B3A|nr:response regulator transcription factor [endosymbiont of Lamellibrachia barhami]